MMLMMIVSVGGTSLMSWFPYDSIRKVVYIAGRQYAQQAGGDLVYITQLPH
jgi:hypothetical protein